jgi:hypothetical protein
MLFRLIVGTQVPILRFGSTPSLVPDAGADTSHPNEAQPHKCRGKVSRYLIDIGTERSDENTKQGEKKGFWYVGCKSWLHKIVRRYSSFASQYFLVVT